MYNLLLFLVLPPKRCGFIAPAFHTFGYKFQSRIRHGYFVPRVFSQLYLFFLLGFFLYFLLYVFFIFHSVFPSFLSIFVVYLRFEIFPFNITILLFFCVTLSTCSTWFRFYFQIKVIIFPYVCNCAPLLEYSTGNRISGNYIAHFPHLFTFAHFLSHWILIFAISYSNSENPLFHFY